jgi:hypothetical protein
MFSLAKLFSQKKKPARKNNNFRPQLEGLEKREVMSASSLALHAVTDAYGNNVAVFEGTYTNNGNQFTGLISSSNQLGGAGPLSNVIPIGKANTPQTVESFSLGLDAKGGGDLFVKATDGSFWDLDLTDFRWVKLQTPGNIQVESFAAVDGGRVYAIFQDGSLNVFTPITVNSAPGPDLVLSSPVTQPFGIWEHVYGAGSVTALDAVTDKRGHDAVFVENSDKSFGEFYSPTGASLSVPVGQAYVGPYNQLAAAGHNYLWFDGKVYITTYSQIGTFSAGTDANGYADVFATYDGYLDRYYYGAGWKEIALPKTFQSFSATDSGVAWIIGADGSLERYNGSTIQEITNSGGPERSVAGASSLTAFVTYPNNEIEGYFLDPNSNNLGESWGLGTTPN